MCALLLIVCRFVVDVSVLVVVVDIAFVVFLLLLLLLLFLVFRIFFVVSVASFEFFVSGGSVDYVSLFVLLFC